jgi:hypothetical protein
MAKFQIVSTLLSLVVSLVLVTDSHQHPGIRGGEIDQEKRLDEAEARTNDNASRELNLVQNQINIHIPVDGIPQYFVRNQLYGTGVKRGFVFKNKIDKKSSKKDKKSKKKKRT